MYIWVLVFDGDKHVFLNAAIEGEEGWVRLPEYVFMLETWPVSAEAPVQKAFRSDLCQHALLQNNSQTSSISPRHQKGLKVANKNQAYQLLHLCPPCSFIYRPLWPQCFKRVSISFKNKM